MLIEQTHIRLNINHYFQQTNHIGYSSTSTFTSSPILINSDKYTNVTVKWVDHWLFDVSTFDHKLKNCYLIQNITNLCSKISPTRPLFFLWDFHLSSKGTMPPKQLINLNVKFTLYTHNYGPKLCGNDLERHC